MSTETADPWVVIRHAAETVRGWPESYAEPLAAWLELAAAESHSAFYGPNRPHPALAVATEMLADAQKAARHTAALNQARRG